MKSEMKGYVFGIATMSHKSNATRLTPIPEQGSIPNGKFHIVHNNIPKTLNYASVNVEECYMYMAKGIQHYLTAHQLALYKGNKTMIFKPYYIDNAAQMMGLTKEQAEMAALIDGAPK